MAELSQLLHAPATDKSTMALSRALNYVDAQKYPELDQRRMRLATFHSSSDYFRTRFSITRFLFLLPMRYSVEVNPRLFERDAPSDGVCAILGHESAHLVTLSHGNRIRRFSLLRLLSKRYSARFERRADLEAIRRGFAPGLIVYREWVYKNIPADKIAAKKRNYFGPEEIAAVVAGTSRNPDLFAEWQKHVPLSLAEIEATVKSGSGQNPGPF